MVLALALLVLLKFLVDLEQYSEAEVVTHDLKPRQILHELVHQFEPGRRIKRGGLESEERLALVVASLLRENAQVRVALAQLLDNVLHFLEFLLRVPGDTAVGDEELDETFHVDL